jgi:hypothetical protein
MVVSTMLKRNPEVTFDQAANMDKVRVNCWLLTLILPHINQPPTSNFQESCTVKPVYKGHSREPENVSFMNSCPLDTG